MVIFGQKWFYSGKVVVFWQKGLYSGKVVVFRQKWRSAVQMGVKMFEQNRLTELDRKRAFGKAKE